MIKRNFTENWYNHNQIYNGAPNPGATIAKITVVIRTAKSGKLVFCGRLAELIAKKLLENGELRSQVS